MRRVLRASCEHALALFAFSVPVSAFVPVGLPFPAPFDSFSSLLAIIVLAMLGVDLATAPFGWRRPGAAFWAWAALVAWHTVSGLWATDSAAFMAQFVAQVSVVAFLGAVSAWRPRRSTARRVELGYVLGCVAVGCAGLLSALSGASIGSSRTGEARFNIDSGAADGSGQANHVAAAILFGYVLALGHGLPSKGRPARWAWLAGAGIIGLAVVSTGSRTGMLLLVVATAVVVVERRVPLRVAVPGALAAALLLTAVVPAATLDRALGKSEDGNGSGRDGLWATLLAVCEQRCLFGVGSGGQPRVYVEHRSEHGESDGTHPNTVVAHNIYLAVVVETGLVGLALLALALSGELCSCLRLQRGERAVYLLGLAAIVVAHALQPTFWFKFVWLYFALLHLRGAVGAVGTDEAADGLATSAPRWASQLARSTTSEKLVNAETG